MRFLRALFVTVLAALQSACGNLQAVQVASVPDDFVRKGLQISDARPTKESVAPRGHEVPGQSLFLEQTTGGSLAVGLLFGPLGVLANRANIDRLTREMGESGAKSSLYSIDALELARSAWSGQISSVPGPAASIQLKPYLFLLVQDEKLGINSIVSVRAEATDNSQKPWTGNYYYCMDRVLPMTSLQNPLPAELMSSYREAVTKGFGELLTEIQVDLSSGPKPARDIAWVVSPSCRAGMPGDIGKNASGHTTLRSMWGDYGRIYNLFIFPTDSQYKFDNGPVPREKK